MYVHTCLADNLDNSRTSAVVLRVIDIETAPVDAGDAPLCYVHEK